MATSTPLAQNLEMLQSLGFTLPSPAYIVGVIIFSIVGIVAWGYGRRAKRPRTRWLGLALMLYPYIVSRTWLLYVVGAALTAAILFDRG
jgi:ABC-type multidrug transport system permease subunit